MDRITPIAFANENAFGIRGRPTSENYARGNSQAGGVLTKGGALFNSQPKELVLGRVIRADEYALPSFFIVNDVVAGPQFADLSYAGFCVLKRVHRLYEIKAAIVTHFGNAKQAGRTRQTDGTVRQLWHESTI